MRAARHAASVILLRVALTVGAALSLAVTADAAEVLKFKNGDLVAGQVVLLDDDGITFRSEDGKEMRVPWERLYPVSRYELWESTIQADDAAGRFALAKWCVDAGLFVQARREAVKAQGLGYSGAAEVGKLITDIDRIEADHVLARVDELLTDAKLNAALDEIRRYLRSAPPGEHADRVRKRVSDIMLRKERLEALKREQLEQEKRERQLAKKQDWVDQQIARARSMKESGSDHAIDGFASLAKGNQSRARQNLERAERSYDGARKLFRKVGRALGSGDVADTMKLHMQDCDRRTLEVLIRWGSIEVDNRAWKKASPIVDRGLRIDPVQRELLELRKKIDENWVRRKLSGLTNASGRESSR